MGICSAIVRYGGAWMEDRNVRRRGKEEERRCVAECGRRCYASCECCYCGGKTHCWWLIEVMLRSLGELD
jgi:hypothetical protein